MNVLGMIRETAANCTLCELHKGRKNPVFDKGNPEADVMICGMVPAYEENENGIPFVGRAGRLLDKILAEVELTLNDVYVSNIVKCFLAPGNPLKEEWINACLPYLICQITCVVPKVIITLGLDATIGLTGSPSDTTMRSVRGKVLKYGPVVDVVPTYHPSFLLRKGGEKSDFYKKVVEDFELAKYIEYQKRGK